MSEPNAEFGYSMQLNPWSYITRAVCDCGWSTPACGSPEMARSLWAEHHQAAHTESDAGGKVTDG